LNWEDVDWQKQLITVRDEVAKQTLRKMGNRRYGLGELSKRMGNSEAVCKRHYLETLTREEGKSWFALRRSTGAP
jgi:hypothetical protein